MRTSLRRHLGGALRLDGPNGADPANCYFVMQGDGTGEGFTLPFGAEPSAYDPEGHRFSRP